MDRYPARVDPSQMETEIGREMAVRYNSGVAKAEERLHRLRQVLNEYTLYKPDFRLDLAEASIVWAIASLAMSDRRGECESNFYAFVEFMYVLTQDSEQSMRECDREQILVAAGAVQRHLTPAIGDILRSSAHRLVGLDDQNPFRAAAEVLHRIRTVHLEHAHPLHLRGLIAHCVELCGTIDCFQLGAGPFAEVLRAIEAVADVTSHIRRTVLAAIDAGELLVKDGRIISGAAQ